MKPLVIDASVAIKWVVEEPGTPAALALRRQAKLSAPDLLVAECANVLWKKVGRNELTDEEALLAARLLQASDVELLPTRNLMEAATRFALDRNHPAYDCVYLAAAIANDGVFVTADERLVHEARAQRAVRDLVILLRDAVEI